MCVSETLTIKGKVGLYRKPVRSAMMYEVKKAQEKRLDVCGNEDV